ncbi:MAG TPA: glycosyltransferase family A protein [Saprospiraceae bacterium]|nr:glycosyltransferase family A protein [Saprospiraceae bacterium]
MVSVIIPFINEYTLLQEAVQSVQAQDMTSWELIIVRNHAEPFDPNRKSQLPPDTKFIHEPQPGSAFARNAGLQAASGDWIQFLDVDDLLLPGKISHQLSQQDGDAVVSPHLFQSLDGRRIKSRWISDDLWSGLLNSGLGSTSSMLFRKQALLEVGGWNQDYQSHQEYEVLFRLMKTGKKVLAIDQTETVVRARSSGSITKSTIPIRAIEGVKLRESMWHFLEASGMTSPARYDAFRQYVFQNLRGLFKINAGQAMEKYKEYFNKKEFEPAQIPFTGYHFFYKTFGFALTEHVINLFT